MNSGLEILQAPAGRNIGDRRSVENKLIPFQKPHRGEILVENKLISFPKPQRGKMYLLHLNIDLTFRPDGA